MKRVRLWGCVLAVLMLTLTVAAQEKKAEAKGEEKNWRPLFDGKTLSNWKVIEFGGEGEAKVTDDGNLRLNMGETVSGVVYTGDAKKLPKINYEISLDAQRYDGSDFFVGLTFPYKDSFATLVIGGWGGAVCGISSIDGEDAAHNSTATAKMFKNKQWYKVRLRLTEGKIEAWIDNEKIVDEVTEGKEIDTRADIDLSKPLGLTTYQTTALIRDIKIRELTDKEVGELKRE